MRQHVVHLICITLAAGAVFFTNLGAAHLWDEDETLHGTCAREMYERGDWVVPTYNGNLFPDKPPLMYWLMIGGYELFGVTEFAARFAAAVLGVAAALVTYYLGRVAFNATVGLWAGLAMAANLLFTVSARAATADAALVFLTTTALLLFFVALRRQPEDSSRPLSWPLMAGSYALLGIAVLAKGPIGIALPVIAWTLLLQIEGARRSAAPSVTAGSPLQRLLVNAIRSFLRWFAPRNVARAIYRLRPLTALIVVAAVAVPWYVLVGMRTEGVWLQEFFGDHNLQRALRPREGHSGPFFYYIPALLIGFFPWSVFLGPTLADSIRRLRGDDDFQRPIRLLLCWTAVLLLIWSVPRTKLPHYVLTLFPALALLTGCFIQRWIAAPAQFSRWWTRNAGLTFIVVGLGMIAALPVVSAYFLPGEGLLGLAGLPLIVGGAAIVIAGERIAIQRAVQWTAVTSVAFLVGIFGFAALRVDRYQNAPPMLAAVEAAGYQPEEIVAYHFLRPSFVYYAGRPIQHFTNAELLGRQLDEAGGGVVLTTGQHAVEIDTHFPGRFEVLARQPMFLRNREVVILAPATTSEIAAADRRVSTRPEVLERAPPRR